MINFKSLNLYLKSKILNATDNKDFVYNNDSNTDENISQPSDQVNNEENVSLTTKKCMQSFDRYFEQELSLA